MVEHLGFQGRIKGLRHLELRNKRSHLAECGENKSDSNCGKRSNCNLIFQTQEHIAVEILGIHLVYSTNGIRIAIRNQHFRK